MSVSRQFRLSAACCRASFALLFFAGILSGVPRGALAQDRNLTPAPVDKEQRLALLIGNSNYKEAPLRNPVNDATDMGKALEALGFKVMLRLDANRRQMREAMRDFARELKGGGVGLFYFAGHGVQSAGKNFLLPVGADVREQFDLVDEAVDANVILAGMEEAGNSVNIVILDACRNNPFARAWRSAVSEGLAQMNAPTGSFIAFATAPGSVAADGSGKNGIFTKHLLDNLNRGDSDIDRVFTRVTASVARETGNRQVPWKSSSLTAIFRFRDSDRLASIAPPSDAAEIAFWQSIKESTRAAEFDAYLEKYPNGQFVLLAKAAKVRLEEERRARQEQQRVEQARLEEENRASAEDRARREEEVRLRAPSTFVPTF